jgi:plastocyanin
MLCSLTGCYSEVSAMKLNMIGLLLALGMLSQGAVADGDVHLVIIKDFKFSPQEVTVKPGETIRWENHEKRQYHSVWFEALGEEQPDYFFPEEFYERTFETSGSLPYRCGPHPEMTGVVHVTD